MARVLVIDDQNIPRKTAQAMLQDGGHEVATEPSGEAGLERTLSWHPDVIILDVHMPGMDGFEVVTRLKADPETSNIPVIFLTGSARGEAMTVQGLHLGAYDFLMKGCPKEELLARVGVMARIKKNSDEMSALARISGSLIQTLEPVAMARLFLEQATAVFRANAAALFFGQGEQGETPFRAAVGFDAEHASVSGLATALLAWLEDNAADADVIPLDELDGTAKELLKKHDYRSAVAARFGQEGRDATVAVVFSGRENGFRRESDGALLQLLVGQASVAMENALLHVRTRDQTVALEKAMTERSRFFASMSHEIRTPINAVLGYNQLLAEGTMGQLSEKQRQAVTKVGRSANHLLELINDILDISKIEAGKIEIEPEPTELGMIVRDTATSVQLVAEEKGLDLAVEASAETRIETDPARLRQIVLNLLANAVKFTEEGSVTARVAKEDKGWVRLVVEDTGPGIAPEDQERVFEEFEQAGKSAGKVGTGLGLSISRKLARLLGGDLTVKSEPGEGSTFTLRLPVRAPLPEG
ncbi:MAG: ATP-binding response regulator [Longimicrobiaceae bacterium]